VPARFGTLRDHDIDAAGLEPARFLDRGGAAPEHGAGGLDCGNHGWLGQPEVETDHLGPRRLDQGQVLGPEARVGQGRPWRLAQAALGEEGSQQLAHPGRIAATCRRLRVAEEVDVQEPGTEPAGLLDLRPRGLDRLRAAAERAQPAGRVDRGRELRGGGPGHGRLHDGPSEAQPLG
jgi:hypothetical protein